MLRYETGEANAREEGQPHCQIPHILDKTRLGQHNISQGVKRKIKYPMTTKKSKGTVVSQSEVMRYIEKMKRLGNRVQRDEAVN